jgi:hypothetical protein
MAACDVNTSVCERNVTAGTLCFHLQGSVSDRHDLTRSSYGDVRRLSKNGHRHVFELYMISFSCIPPFVSRINA